MVEKLKGEHLNGYLMAYLPFFKILGPFIEYIWHKRKQNTVVWIVFQPYLFSLQEPKEPQTMEKADCGKFNICQQEGLREKSSKKILFIYIETVKGNTLWEVVFPTYKILGHSFPQKSLFFGNNH